ncbi:CRASP family complement regulator-acquiring lipoprotein (plasmid) [Borreliella andersonii]|uniref:CRASP family complement regulator-acquiring lipoprotein n=1 Tax=Borrelia andersonii TaxID=42109 RepID=A0ABZ0CG72_BORAD|nr:CRASP family complement regulator-acquiring lipoprotein [Borreliella andersonii]WNY66327.1 CRASP family complement regulator-acquiring lipoprotein [Borreliella andersonii]
MEKFLSIKTTVSEMMHQLLLDYQNNINSIKTDENKLKSHVNTLSDQIIKHRKRQKS